MSVQSAGPVRLARRSRCTITARRGACSSAPLATPARRLVVARATLEQLVWTVARFVDERRTLEDAIPEIHVRKPAVARVLDERHDVSDAERRRRELRIPEKIDGGDRVRRLV